MQDCFHGGPNYAEFESLGIRPDSVLDFSSNSNPYPFKLDFTLDAVVIDHYPDSDSTELRRLIAEENRLALENVIIGNGSTEIIRLIALAYVAAGDRVLILKPTFGEYEQACRISGAEIVELWAEAKTSFSFDVRRCTEAMAQLKPKVIFICNPNNPSGQFLCKAEVESLLAAAGDGLVVLDEAYIAFTEDAWDSTSLLDRENLIIIRSMTKDFALAGLRLGYGLGDPKIINILCKVKPPWNVNTVAQCAGVQAINDGAYIHRSDRLIRCNRDYLVAELSALGYQVVPTKTNFFLVLVGQAREFRAALMRYGIIVRDCGSFGLPEYVRIAPRTLPECRKLLEAVKAISWCVDIA
ncbi:L-threonine 3-O-phosphate decarboxylase [Dehalogenimonas sp. WBC-2]|nr:L-threonine 3-O-phosphate decarboxylase [Dehalogenimonas sp. WBC-2]